eukprot:Phypoly_transcript_07351.p1 GENE.Phypoly_transcript_07351~~Phypoly_transcript_07351.p1  ORF type:complete len:426 (+),score=30.26 Phypoly_transcript_07351:73-1278(+)
MTKNMRPLFTYTDETILLRKRSLQGGIVVLAGFGVICAIFLYVYNHEDQHTPDIPFSITITNIFLNCFYVLLASILYATTTFEGEHSEGVNTIRLVLYLAFFLAVVVADVGAFIMRMSYRDGIMMALAASNMCEAYLTCTLLSTAARFQITTTRSTVLFTLMCLYFLLFNILSTYFAIHGLFEFEFTFPAMQIVLKGLYIAFRTQSVAILVSLLTSTLGSKSHDDGAISSHGGVICKNLHPQQLYCSALGAVIGMLIGTLYVVYGVNGSQWSGVVFVGAVLGILLAIVVPGRITRTASTHFDWEHMLVFGCFYAGKMIGTTIQLANGAFNLEWFAVLCNVVENSLQIVVVVFLMSSQILELVPKRGPQAFCSTILFNLQNSIGFPPTRPSSLPLSSLLFLF